MVIAMPRAVAALSISYEPDSKDVVLLLKSAAGSPFEVRLQAGIAAGIAVGIVALGKKFGPASNAAGIDAQPMTVTAAQSGLIPDGRPMLDLVLEGSLHFPITFPPSAIPILQKALSELQELTKTTSKGPPIN